MAVVQKKVWFTPPLPSVTYLIGVYGQTRWIKPLFWFLLPYCCFICWQRVAELQQAQMYMSSADT